MGTKVRTKFKWVLAIVFFGFLLLQVLKLYPSLKTNTDVHQADNLNWVATTQGFIHIQTFRHLENTDSVKLVVVIHGDLDKPGYHYRSAQLIAQESRNVIAVGILRPGYTDPENNTSNGRKGLTSGDNYTPQVISTISELIWQLKQIYHPVETIAVGHSGGAAILGDLIGLKPALVDKAVLVSGPYDVSKWRHYMWKQQNYDPVWLLPVQSISPLSVTSEIGEKTGITIIVGEKDPVAPPALSREYYSKLLSENKKARLIIIPGAEHNILLNDKVLDVIFATVNDERK